MQQQATEDWLIQSLAKDCNMPASAVAGLFERLKHYNRQVVVVRTRRDIHLPTLPGLGEK